MTHPMTALRDCPAPAKLNLFLHVTGRRDDGYHLLQTVFQLVDWADTLHFTRRDDGVIRRVTAITGVPEDADLTVRAARLLQQAAGCRFGVDIEIEKRLPMGGGLGGGSSDAATVLLALNRLWGLNGSRQALQDLGVALGADVPFFLFGENAWATGIGEALTPVPLPPRWFLIVTPPVSVPTAAIFSAPELTRDTESYTLADFLGEPDPFAFGHNDLQPVAAAKYAEIADVLAALRPFDAAARMTGSGSCVFASFACADRAKAAAAALPAHWQATVAPGLPNHPLRGFA